MQLETINKLYLELSQVATATTAKELALHLELSQVATATAAKELALHEGIGEARQIAMELCWQIEKSGASEELTKCSLMAASLEAKLNDLLP